MPAWRSAPSSRIIEPRGPARSFLRLPVDQRIEGAHHCGLASRILALGILHSLSIVLADPDRPSARPLRKDHDCEPVDVDVGVTLLRSMPLPRLPILPPLGYLFFSGPLLMRSEPLLDRLRPIRLRLSHRPVLACPCFRPFEHPARILCRI